MISLLIATRNAHKTREFAGLLGPEFVLEDLRSHPHLAEVVEDGATFAANARIKALAVSRQLPGLVLADDSGLEVDSLGGAPGVFSARYAGLGATDEANRRKLLAELAKRGPDAARTARFRCALVLARDGHVLAICEGSVAGEIVRQARGSAGFGYDPLFQPNGLSETFAELSPVVKNAISHRGCALTKLKPLLPAGDIPK
ncbi:MAG TPA: RdgB/HAM1 family non-canonical purine NTP pyrophosphatase [Chthoniobacterales bacterium]